MAPKRGTEPERGAAPEEEALHRDPLDVSRVSSVTGRVDEGPGEVIRDNASRRSSALMAFSRSGTEAEFSEGRGSGVKVSRVDLNISRGEVRTPFRGDIPLCGDSANPDGGSLAE